MIPVIVAGLAHLSAPRARFETPPVPVVSHLTVIPPDWAALAACESTDNPRAVDPTGRYFGLFQFDVRTWRSVGGVGNPADATRGRQLTLAERLYTERGSEPWPVCGRLL